MTISDVNINFRAPERTHSRIKDLMKLFERDRSWTCRQAADVFWTLMFDTAKLLPFIEEWQVFKSKNAQHDVAQMRIYFPAHPDDVAFRPMFRMKEHTP